MSITHYIRTSVQINIKKQAKEVQTALNLNWTSHRPSISEQTIPLASIKLFDVTAGCAMLPTSNNSYLCS